MPNNLPRIALVHGSNYPFFFQQKCIEQCKLFSVASNIGLWKDLYLLYRLSTSLLLVVTYPEVGHFFFLYIGLMIELKECII